MDLTPIDLKKQEFRRVLRGYDPLQVRRFLDDVADAWEGLIRSQEELRQRTVDLGETIENYRRIERTLNETLLAAQRIAEESREASLREADILRKEAEMDGRRIVDRAEAEASRLHEQIRTLRLERDNLFRRLRDLVEEELLRIHTMREEHAGARRELAGLQPSGADLDGAEELADTRSRGALPPAAHERVDGAAVDSALHAQERAWSSTNGESALTG